MLDAARASRCVGKELRGHTMSIFVNENTKVIVQGLTGGQGKYHGSQP